MLCKQHVKQMDFIDRGSKNVLFLEPVNDSFPNNELKLTYLQNVLRRITCQQKVQHIIGSSASAVIALLLGIGYTAEEIQAKLNSIDFKKFIGNENSIPLTIVAEDNISNIKGSLKKKQFKCLKGDKFLVWAQQQIMEKLGDPLATFANLNKQTRQRNVFTNIHLVGLNLTTGRLVIFNYKNTPDMPIAIAVRICMSFSMIFPMVEIKDVAMNKKYVYVDGGIILQHFNLITKIKNGCDSLKFGHWII